MKWDQRNKETYEAGRRETLDADGINIIILLKKLFNSYEKEVLRIHEKYSKKIPKAYNSTASQGNFLEVLNMSLNVFEKHYLDRSFDRTGQLSVLISPGVGVFEVDQDLTNITKQRIIDNGIGSDLVCLGEQPLHAVPLFKYYNKNQQASDFNFSNICGNNNYNMPHWINLSFYTSKRQSRFSIFIPRIKMPNIVPKNNLDVSLERDKRLAVLDKKNDKNQLQQNLKLPAFVDNSRSWFLNESLLQIEKRTNTQLASSNNHNFDELEAEYDKYDRDVFYALFAHENNNEKEKSASAASRIRKKSVLSSPFSVISTSNNARLDDSINNSSINQLSKSNRILRNKQLDELDGPKIKISKQDEQLKEDANQIIKQQRTNKTINPFNPRNIPFKLTSNRRRWTHVFPLGSNGVFMQQHHYCTFQQNTACTLLPIASSNDLRKTSSSYHLNASLNVDNLSLLNAINLSQNTDELDTINDYPFSSNQTPDQFTLYNFSMKEKRISLSEREGGFKNKNHSNYTLTYDDENFVLTTKLGVDYKSLVIPACLPLTTDYLPDTKSLENDYLDSEYSLIPEFQSADLYERRCYKDEDHHNHYPLKTDQVFQEFVCQRLQQGFQVIMNQSYQVLQLQSSTPLQANTPNMSKTDNLELKVKKLNATEAASLNDKYYVMSIGRIFHRLELDNSTVKVKTYRPRLALNNNVKIHYCYRFRAPDHDLYGVSWVDFETEKLEIYNWSYLDNYICLRGGEDEYELRENLKFWRLRMLLLPSMQQQTRQILNNIDNISINGDNFNCDIYSKINVQERFKLQKGFLKFFSIINRIKNQPTKTTAKESVKQQQTINNPDLNSRRFSSGFTGSFRHNSAESTFRERINSANTETTIGGKSSGRRGLLFNDKLLTRNDDASNLQAASITESEFRNSIENIDNLESIKKLSSQNHSSIIDAMKNGFNNFQFLPKQNQLPNFLFTSADAVQWSIQSIENVQNEQQSLALFQKLLDSKLICHASSQINYPFKYGFFLYYIVIKNNKLSDERIDLEMYKREWFEVEISNSSASPSNASTNSQQPTQPLEQAKYSRLKNPINSIKFSLNSASNSNQKQVEANANNMQTTKRYKLL